MNELDRKELHEIMGEMAPILGQLINKAVLGALREHRKDVKLSYTEAELKIPEHIAKMQREAVIKNTPIGDRMKFDELKMRPTSDEYINLTGEFDATKWAGIFVRTHPNCGLNDDNMTSWFANAIMAGYDHHAKEERTKHKRMGDSYDIQGADGNWDANEYMLGLFNGMEHMMAIMEDREPQFRTLPEPTEAPKTVQDALEANVWAQVYAAMIPQIGVGSQDAASIANEAVKFFRESFK